MKKIIYLFVGLAVILPSCSYLKKHAASVVNPKATKEINHFNVAWTKNLNPVYDTGNLPVFLNTPLIHQGILYCGDNRGMMSAYELTNGRMIWQKDGHISFSSRPIMYGDNIIYGAKDGGLYSRNALTGKLNYKVDLGAPVESDILITRDRLFLQTRNHKIFSLDAKVGKILWGYKRSVPFLTTLQRASTPASYKNNVLVGFADGSLVSLSLEEGTILWERKLSERSKFVDVDISPLVINNKIYVNTFDGPLLILNAKTGHLINKVMDVFPARVPVYNSKNKTLEIGTVRGEIVQMSLSGVVISKNKIADDSVTSVIAWDKGKAIGSLSGKIIFLSQDKAKEIKQFEFGHNNSVLYGKLALGGNHLAALSSRGRLYVFRSSKY